MKAEAKTVTVTPEIANKIEVLRYKDDKKNGNQRPFEEARMKSMVENLSNGDYCPPIVVGDLGGKFYCLDGQHRLGAWQRSKMGFSLKAEIIPLKDYSDAKKQFIALNGYQKRVSLSHRLAIDPSKYASKLRVMANKFAISFTDANSVMMGVVGVWNSHTKMGEIVTESHWKTAHDFLKIWKDDKRWGKRGQIYSNPGTMRVVMHIACKSSNLEKALKSIKTMSFENAGTLAKYYGGSATAQRHMRDIIYQHLAKKSIV